MVTTTSLSGDLNFKAAELFKSELAEDHQIAEMAAQQLGALVEKLLPVLIYVDRQIGGIRGVEIVKDGNYTLVLGREGKWYSGLVEDKKLGLGLGQDLAGWQYFILSKIVEGLQHCFDEATKKKEAHQAAVAKRRDLLNKVGAVIRGEAVPAAETK